MGTTYQKANDDVADMLDRRILQFFPRLRDAGVKVGVVMALNTETDAIKHGGYPVFACIKIVSLKDRVTKAHDAEMLIDETRWNQARDEEKLALLDHELSHIDIVDLNPKELKAARNEDQHAPAWKLDDLGRPKLRSVPGDWNCGDGFTEVVARHGLNAVEWTNIRAAQARAEAARRLGEQDRAERAAS